MLFLYLPTCLKLFIVLRDNGGDRNVIVTTKESLSLCLRCARKRWNDLN